MTEKDPPTREDIVAAFLYSALKESGSNKINASIPVLEKAFQCFLTEYPIVEKLFRDDKSVFISIVNEICMGKPTYPSEKDKKVSYHDFSNRLETLKRQYVYWLPSVAQKKIRLHVQNILRRDEIRDLLMMERSPNPMSRSRLHGC